MAISKAIYRAKYICTVVAVTGSVVATGYTCNQIFKIAKVKSEMTTYEQINCSKILFVRDATKKKSWRKRVLDICFDDHVVSIDDVNKMRTILECNDNKQICAIIKSTGGNAYRSIDMMKIMGLHDNIHAFVPEYAYSAATIFTLACTTIYMGKYSSLSCTDVQSIIKTNKNSYTSVNFPMLVQYAEKQKGVELELLSSLFDASKIYELQFNGVKKYLEFHRGDNVTDEQMENLLRYFASGNHLHEETITSKKLGKVLKLNRYIPKPIQSIYDQMNNLYS